jgi:acyl carrier protein
MGLDSVELVLEFESFFDLDIPDKEAEKMVTVQHAIEYISSNINFVDRKIDLKNYLFDSIRSVFFNLTITSTEISPSDKVFDLVEFSDIETWNEISSTLNLKIPDYPGVSMIDRFLSKMTTRKMVNLNTVTFDRFIDLLAGQNYQKLIVKKSIQNEWEVYICIMGLICDKLGVYPYEVFRESSFVNDFGID